MPPPSGLQRDPEPPVAPSPPESPGWDASEVDVVVSGDFDEPHPAAPAVAAPAKRETANRTLIPLIDPPGDESPDFAKNIVY
jgi:hypothetical protein